MQVLASRLGAVISVAVIGVSLGMIGPVSPAQAVAGAPATSAAPADGGCYPIDFTWVCVDSGGTGGSPGSGGSATYTCTYTKASEAVLQRTGTGPPAVGAQGGMMTSPGSNNG